MKTDFGTVRDGKCTLLYILKNDNGLEMHVSDYGASWVAALVPDAAGTVKDVLLGYDDAAGYEAGGEAIGAIVGRVANRTRGAAFELNGKVYYLSKNKGNDNLHSGPEVYQKRIWSTVEADEQHVIFELHSPDGDQGYPGAMTVRVTYELKEDNGFYISYCAESDADTIWNMTNHAYFNLNGHESGMIFTHELQVNADGYTETNESSIPTGRIIPVVGTPMDFRVKKVIGRDIEAEYKVLIDANGYDHNWTINGKGFRKAAELTGDTSGIIMEVYTDRPGVQIYAGNYLNDEKGKNGAIYGKRSGICFETQNYPDAIHHSEFPSPVLRAGDILKTTSMYRFLTKSYQDQKIRKS